jgi:hypothetical protein
VTSICSVCGYRIEMTDTWYAIERLATSDVTRLCRSGAHKPAVVNDLARDLLAVLYPRGVTNG